MNGQRQPVFAGSRVTVPLSATGTPSGVPSPPEPYTLASLQSLPVGNLSNPVDISAPLSDEAITNQLGQWQAAQAAIYGPTTQTTSTSGTTTSGSSPTGSTTTSSTGTVIDPVTGAPVPPPPDDSGSAPPPPPPDDGGSAPPPPPPDDGGGSDPGDPGFLPPGHGGTPPGQEKKS